MSQRYYIAVPKKIEKWGYQTIPTWKNYSFTGTLREAQETAIELFTEEGHLEEDMLKNIEEYYDSGEFDKISSKWDEMSDDDQYETCKTFYEEYLKFICDDYNSGLELWDEVSNEYMKQPFNDEVVVIELN